MTSQFSIQGYPGSFHEEAARNFFGKNIEVIPCATFKEVIRIAETDKDCSGAVMAIENSIAGSILANYNLLQKTKLQIVGEIYLQIAQHLMVNPGVKLEEIREVHSHPMALQQCETFLEKHTWKLVEKEDTALSADLIHRHKHMHAAAIACRTAAKLYQLDIIAPNIHTLKNNYTRFLFLQKAGKEDITDCNKASISFHTDHSRGSLAKVLTEIAEGGINLSKLQSFPIPGSDFKYKFHADMEFDDRSQFEDIIGRLKNFTEAITVFGVYKKGVWK